MRSSIPDGRLWLDRLSEGLSETDATLSAGDGERIVRLVAHHVGAEVNAESPRVSAELPETGERFAPTFRQPQARSRGLRAGRLRRRGHHDRRPGDDLAAGGRPARSILITGGTSTGKTTLANGPAGGGRQTGDLVVLIEDTR